MMRPRSVFLLCTISLLAAITAFAECYHLTYTPNGGFPEPRRAGEPLDAEQNAGVSAAIAKLAAWEALCGVQLDLPSGDEEPQTGSGKLAKMLQDGDICEEVVAPDTIGATTSNPVTGNGSDGKGEFLTQGHPGINIKDKFIPKPVDGSFDPTAVASLAAQLIHELSHLTNPNNAAADQGEYESTAYRHAAEQLCKVASCPSASTEDKAVACQYIQTANGKLCQFGEDQVDCPGCPGSKVDCPPPIQREGIIVEPQGPNIPTERHYIEGGTVDLYPFANELRFNILSVDFSLDFDDTQLDFRATSLAALHGDRVIAGGRDTVTHEGEFVEVLFDPSAGAILSVATICQGTGFKEPSSMVGFDFGPSAEVVFFIESLTHDVKVLVPWLATCLPVLSAVTEPRLLDCFYLNARHDAGGRYTLIACSHDEEAFNAPLVSNIVSVYMTDVDGNGSIDHVQ